MRDFLGVLALMGCSCVASSASHYRATQEDADVDFLLRPAPPPTVLVYQRLTYDVCSNYFPAIEILKKTLGSSTSGPVQCAPSDDPKVQRCQRALRGCNVCAMLVDGSGPGLDWALDRCHGKHYPETGRLSVCNNLCSKDPPQSLASTLLHESIHRCQHEGYGQ